MSAPRRNGLPSSCEPCRKSKLRCDHATPCSRCRRRKKPALCVYHPAPMTKQLSLDRSRSAETVNRSVVRTALPSPNTSRAGSTPQQNVPTECNLRAKFIADWSKKTASSPGTGVLGPTSYSAVYDENEDVIKSSPAVAATSLEDSSKSLRKNLTTVDHGQIQLGAELLLFLFEDFNLYERMAVSRYVHCEGYVFAPSLLRLLFASVRHMLNAAIEDRSNPLPDLFKLSNHIFESFSKPIHVDPHMTPQDYFISMPNRWEIISVIFSTIGASSYLLPASEIARLQTNGETLDYTGLAFVSIAAGDKCLSFCDNAGIMTEPLSWALLAHSSLLTHIYGDHDYRPWKALGDLCTLVFALGYHQRETSSMLPFFLVEHRKRLLLGAYSIDKELATFIGRPPRISWRHIDVDLPLDITYEELLADPEIRDAAVEQLDMDGWNKHGFVSKTSFARSLYVMGQVRELVLELSLNSRIDDLEGKIREISELARQKRSRLPARFQEVIWLDSRTVEESEANQLALCIHLDCLYNELIMQRILVKRTGHESSTLKTIAHEMLGTVLAITGNRADDRDHNHIAWIVSFYGLPSAGVLAIELLRQCQNAPPDVDFPRSEVIQNLSRFAADLEYAIPRHAGNYGICQQARKVVRSILDRVLSAPPVPLTPVSAEAAGSVPVEWLTSDDLWLNQDSEFMRWINNFDWNQELPMGG